jgi:hypothetical protein
MEQSGRRIIWGSAPEFAWRNLENHENPQVEYTVPPPAKLLGKIIDSGLANGFINHLYTQIGTTSNYSATANLHTSITTAPAKPFSTLLRLQ